MMTKNLTKPFKGIINGQRLPPIPIVSEQATVVNGPSTTKIDSSSINEPLFPDGNDFEQPRIVFRKSQADVLLLLDTYPPKTWRSSHPAGASVDNLLDQGHTPRDPLFGLPLHHSHGEPIDPFPSPLSDRLPSSRYCRRSVGSACSRRSSILYQRHGSIPLDSTHIQRETSFDTLDESLTEAIRTSYTPLPPIPTDVSLIFSAQPLPGVPPPLAVAEATPAAQEEKKEEESTRRLPSKSLPRESTSDRAMHCSTVTQKTAPIKPIVVPRLQKPATENRRVNSVERHPQPTASRHRLPTTTVCSSVNANTQRSTKFSLDIFQPQPKSSCSTSPSVARKCNATAGRTKLATKATIPKVKVSTGATCDAELPETANDVVRSFSHEASQVVNTDTVNEESLSLSVHNEPPPTQQNDELKVMAPKEPKRHSSSRSSSHYAHRCSQVPKPLTLQGEKVVDADYPQATVRVIPSSTISCQRRGSLSGQPLITHLFEDALHEPVHPIAKIDENVSTKQCLVKPKKRCPTLVKNVKPKKPVVTNKPKTSTTVTGKVQAKSDGDDKAKENVLVVGGTDWVMAVKPQLIVDDEPLLSRLYQVSTVDDEDLPSCQSPTDFLAVSQNTLMTSYGDLERRMSLESPRAIEISPVLAQTIELNPVPSLHPTKSTDPPLINTDIRSVYETVQDSVRKDSSLRSLITPTTQADASASLHHTYNNSDSYTSIGPALRIVNDSLNSRGSETLNSSSSHEDYGGAPLCTDADCDEIYRTARKGRQVGRGAYGVVCTYLTITGRIIAVKEIELDKSDSDSVRSDYEAVREEINILRTLDHSHIVKFLGISLENTHLIKIFMEYLPNGTIENLLIQFGPLHHDVLKKYTRQIVEGVAYLHDKGVVHRDIKGKNIMLDVDGNIKLIDFGCARRLKANQNTHSMRQLFKSMKGTANWMAPEVIAETGHGKKADIWSIGCTLCEMATGKPPWSSEHNQLAVLLIIVNGTRPPTDLPDTCPLAAQEFFRSCLTRDSSLRPSARDLLAHPFLTT